jgi:DNA-binding SARP family transcriptional activator
MSLSVRMLGGLTFGSHGRRVGTDLGANGRLLAAYLLQFPSRIHRREHLASLFWGDKDPEHARATLNTALWRLRKLLSRTPHNEDGGALHSDGQIVVLELATQIQVDTHCFDSAARSALGDATATSGSPCTHALEEAVEGYRSTEWKLSHR